MSTQIINLTTGCRLLCSSKVHVLPHARLWSLHHHEHVSNQRKHTDAHKGTLARSNTRALFFVAGGRTLMCADKWTERSNGGLCFPALWVYGFMGLSPHASLSGRSTIDCVGPVHRGQADRRIATGPLTQGRLICLCKEGHEFEDLSPTKVTSDPKTILALSMSAKMISGSSEGPFYWPELSQLAGNSLNPLHFLIRNLCSSLCGFGIYLPT